MTETNPFETLRLPPTFDLDPARIDRAWLTRSASLHPDRAEGEDASEIARRSALLNRAKETLADPERRADALLETLGGPPASECKDLPDGFLMDIFEVRQAMEEATGSGDPSAKAAFEQLADDRRDAHIARVRELFSSLGDPADKGTLREIRVELNAWRYIERMIEQLD